MLRYLSTDVGYLSIEARTSLWASVALSEHVCFEAWGEAGMLGDLLIRFDDSVMKLRFLRLG